MKKDKKTMIVVLAVIVKDGRILLTKRNQPSAPDYHGKWNIPGGAVEYGEHPEEATIREAQEELGITIRILKTIPHIYHHTDKYRHAIFISYLCEALSNDITLNDESLAHQWVKKDNIQNLNTLDPIIKLLSYI